MDNKLDYEISDSDDAPTKYPFAQMKKGQKCVFKSGVNFLNARSTASRIGAFNGWKFVTRIRDGQMTVWRTK